MDEAILEKLREHGRQNYADRLRFFVSLVNENTFTENIEGINRAQDALESAFWALKMHTERIKCKKRGDILIAKTTPEPKNPIILSGHIDTVHSPKSDFKFCIDQGDRFIGPGTCDMKAGLIQLLITLDMLKGVQDLHSFPIKIVIHSAEEDSTEETQAALVKACEGAQSALVFEFGRENGAIVVERKGILEVQFSSKGKEAHAGNQFFEGVNAIVPLTEIAVKCAALTNKEKGITVNVAQIEGGSHWSTVPGSASMRVQLRSTTREESQELLEKLKSWAADYENISLTVFTDTPPMNRTSGTGKLLLQYTEAGQMVGETLSPMARVGGISDANIISNMGIPVIDGLGPMGGGAHTKEEFVYKESIFQRALILAVFLLNAAKC